MNVEAVDLNNNTRGRIVSAALELFSSLGYDAVSTRKIAEIAKCNIASLNYHFGSKKKLYYACLLQMEPKDHTQLDNILTEAKDKTDFINKLERFCVAFAEFLVINESSIKLLVNEINADNNETVKDSFIKPFIEQLESFVKTAQDGHLINKDIEARFFGRMVTTIILTQKLYKSVRPFEEITDEEIARRLVRSCTSQFFED